MLLASATSLPEMFTTVRTGLMDSPDLAAGGLFGAGMSTMLTLGLIDQLHRSKRVWQHAAFEHTLVAALAMVLTGLAAFAFADLAYREGAPLSAVSPVHALTALWSILLMDLGLMGIISRVEKRYLLIEPDSFVMILGYFFGLRLRFR